MRTTREGLLHIPLGSKEEVRNSSRYHWDNRERGTDPFVIFQFTKRGEGVFEFEGKAHRVPSGHALIAVVPEESRYFYPENARNPWVFSWVNFSGELSLRLWQELRQQAGPVVPLAPSVIRLYQRLIVRASARDWADPYEASLAAYHFYLETLRHLPKRSVVPPLEDAIFYFRTHYQKGIPMKEVAALLGMSREHFTRRFTRQMGCSPAAFLRNLRLETAARLLRTTDLPVTEIAVRSGWASATKLDLFFKRVHGVSPTEYRRRQLTRSERETNPAD